MRNPQNLMPSKISTYMVVIMCNGAHPSGQSLHAFHSRHTQEHQIIFPAQNQTHLMSPLDDLYKRLHEKTIDLHNSILLVLE